MAIAPTIPSRMNANSNEFAPRDVADVQWGATQAKGHHTRGDREAREHLLDRGRQDIGRGHMVVVDVGEAERHVGAVPHGTEYPVEHPTKAIIARLVDAPICENASIVRATPLVAKISTRRCP